MAKALVVVESPAKAKTINKYLGRDYKVVASMGHVRDLPKSKLGVDVEENFEPTYEVIASRKKILKELKDEAKKATTIFMATDPDREGEAIGWHLAEELGSTNKKKIRRLMFNEITKKGVLAALEHTMATAQRVVDAAQARRVADSVTTKERKKSAVPPSITSKLQQASRFPVKKTMMIAQQLYEGVELPGEGSVGLITYMRTDSTRVSEQAIADVRQFVAGAYGNEYVPEKPNVYKAKS